MTAPQAVVVVVPARDEEQLLPVCLRALRAAAAGVDVPTVVVVVADACSDGTADVAAVAGAHVVHCDAGRVGTARRTGVGAALQLLSGVPTEAVWVTSTDADSVVPPGWLAHQVALARDGADLVLGLVELPDEPADTVRPWRAAYARLVQSAGHGHVHAANLGIRGSTYLAAGGWAEVGEHEDVRLVRAVRALADSRTVSSVAEPVLTSPRLLARAPHGLAADLRALQLTAPDAAGR